MSASLPILVAVPNEEGSQVCEYLKNQGFSVVTTHSQEETLEMLREQESFRGIVIISEWAMADKNGSSVGLIRLVEGKIPTVTIVTEISRQQSGYLYMDDVFFPPSHDYMTTPFALDELVARMRKVGMVQ